MPAGSLDSNEKASQLWKLGFFPSPWSPRKKGQQAVAAVHFKKGAIFSSKWLFNANKSLDRATDCLWVEFVNGIPEAEGTTKETGRMVLWLRQKTQDIWGLFPDLPQISCCLGQVVQSLCASVSVSAIPRQWAIGVAASELKAMTGQKPSFTSCSNNTAKLPCLYIPQTLQN